MFIETNGKTLIIIAIAAVLLLASQKATSSQSLSELSGENVCALHF